MDVKEMTLDPLVIALLPNDIRMLHGWHFKDNHDCLARWGFGALVLSEKPRHYLGRRPVKKGPFFLVEQGASLKGLSENSLACRISRLLRQRLSI